MGAYSRGLILGFTVKSFIVGGDSYYHQEFPKITSLKEKFMIIMNLPCILHSVVNTKILDFFVKE